VAASESAVGYDGEDPEHADKDTDTAANYKGDSPTLPATEIHERVMEPRQEGAVMIAEKPVVMFLVSRMVAFRDTSPISNGRDSVISLLVFSMLWVVGMFMVVVMVVVMAVAMMMIGLDQRPAKGLSEAITDFDRLYLDPVHEDSEFALLAMTAGAMAEALGRCRMVAGTLVGRRKGVG